MKVIPLHWKNATVIEKFLAIDLSLYHLLPTTQDRSKTRWPPGSANVGETTWQNNPGFPFEGWSSYFSACCFFHPKKILSTKKYAPTLWLFVWQENQPQTRPEFLLSSFGCLKKLCLKNGKNGGYIKNAPGWKGHCPLVRMIYVQVWHPTVMSSFILETHFTTPIKDFLAILGFWKESEGTQFVGNKEDKQNTSFWFILSSDWCFLHESLTIRKNIFGLVATTVDP